MIESDYNIVTDPTSGMRFRLIIGPHTGPSGTGSVAVQDWANGTLMTQAIVAVVRSILLGSASINIDLTDPTDIVLSATGGGGSYTAENARDDIAAALLGDTSYLLITPDDAGDHITIAIDPAFKARVLALENARSTVQVKENSASGGTANYMNYPGGSGNYIDTPSATAFNVAGDITVIARVKLPASAPGADFAIAGRWGANNAAGQWRWIIKTNGQMQVSVVDPTGVTADTATTTATTPLTFDGAWHWFRLTRTASTGNCNFYADADTGSNNIRPTTYTTFQLNRGTNAGALNATSGAALTIGSYNGGTTNVFTGQIGRVTVHDGNSSGSTIVADANATDYTSGTSWVGPASNTWTIHGTATVVLVGGGATFSTTTKFVLSDTDAFAAIPVAHRDVLYWFSQGGLINTSGSNANFTPEIVVNSVIVSTLPAITLPSVASGVYRYECGLTVEVNASDGTVQVYAWTFRIYDAVTALGGGAATFVGSQISSLILKDYGGGFAGALSTFLAVPKIELKMTHSVSAATVGSGMTNSRLALQKA